MNAFRTFATLVVASLILVGCAAPMPYIDTGHGHPGQRLGGYSAPVTPAGWSNPFTPYMGQHLGRCYFHGFIQPTNELCQNGTIQTPAPVAAPYPGTALGQPNGGAFQAVAPGLVGISPETASMLLAELERRENPCTAEGRTVSTSISAFIGAVAGAVLSRGDARGAVIGGLIGAAGGDSGAVMNCQRYTDTRLALLRVLDAYGCSGLVRRTNGVTTDDEICNYRRRYTPMHEPPQISDLRAPSKPQPEFRAAPR